MASFFDNKARAAAAAAAAKVSGGGSASKDAGKERNERLQPWVEKYRPRSLKEVSSQGHATELLQRLLSHSNLPHMLFYGPPGTGKTSTILALAKSLFGPLLFPSRVLELNASDERGIGIVRSKIKDFARQQLSSGAIPAGPAGEHYKKTYPCPPFKIIVLDEADSMTQDAQSALRRTMETYSKITRFCLVCNYVTRIIDPLASRCSKFRFKSLDSVDAKKRIEEISQAEHVAVNDGASDALVKCAEGDLRKAITFLQSAARLVGAVQIEGGKSTQGRKRKTAVLDDEDDGDVMEVDGSESKTSKTITVRIVEEIAGVIPEAVINGLVTAMQPSSKSSSTFDKISTVVTNLIADGWSATQTVSQLFQRVAFDETISDKAKNKILVLFSETDKRLVDGADEHLTVLDLCVRISGFLA